MTVPIGIAPRRRLRPRAPGAHRPTRRGARPRPGRATWPSEFGVSTVTIRKDLVALEAEGRLIRTHGGAIVAGPATARRAPSTSASGSQRDEKDRIGAAAAALVVDGESIAFDASTTALAVARHLKARGGWTQLTVITNGLRIASELAGHPGHHRR